MNNDPDTLLPARHRRIRDRRARVPESAEVGCQQVRVLREDGEDGADDLAREGRRRGSGAEREEVRGNVLERLVQQLTEVFRDAPEAFSSLPRTCQLASGHDDVVLET